jgi:carbamoyltransferase
MHNILAINPGHNGSAALVSDGKLVYYVEEERLSRMKYDGNPFKAMIRILHEYKIDELIIGGTSNELPQLPWTFEDPYSALVRKYNPAVSVTNLGSQHHLGHAASAFYNSGFETAVAVIVDGAGSVHQAAIGQEPNQQIVAGFETESIYKCGYPTDIEPLYKRYADGNASYFNNGVQEFDNTVTITKAYEAVSDYLGFGFIEAGKTMGLAPYGEYDPKIPEFFIEGKGNKNLLIPLYPRGAAIDENRFPYLKRTIEPAVWHKDFSEVSDVDKNLAWAVQQATQEMLGNLIEQAINLSGETNVVVSGGYGLNCMANYYYKKRFPNINLYIDPIAHDGGTAIGLAKLAWYSHSGSTEPKKLDTLYLGFAPSYSALEDYVKTIKCKMHNTDANKVSQLIADQNIVAVFSGRAEGGPRALGNRSILFDPRTPNGKDIVNQVKGREWFRPFAGSVMAEHADEWFDMRGLEDSPYMMYAVNVQSDKLGDIPAITHVDGTCRIQTVKSKENKNYYELIKSFYEKTGVPILFNTSFNLAGAPLVDSIEDALETILNCDINYLYLPDIKKLIVKE